MAATAADDGPSAGESSRSISRNHPTGYRPLRQLGRAGSALVALSAVVGAADLTVRGILYLVAAVLTAAPEWLPLTYDASRREEWLFSTIPAVEEVLLPARVAWMLLLLVAGLTFVVWLARAAANLRALDTSGAALRPSLAVYSLVALIPALFAVDSIVRGRWLSLVAEPLVVLLCLAAPFVVIRRLWIASATRPGERPATDDAPAAAWNGIVVWWAAFSSFLITSRFAILVISGFGEPIDSMLDSSTVALAIGAFEGAAGISLAIAGYYIIRIMFRVDAMQEDLVAALPQPAPASVSEAESPVHDPDPPTDSAGSVRRSAAQWQCESCDVTNPTALRFCQNCARERR